MAQSRTPFQVLLISNHEVVALTIRAAMATAVKCSFQLEHAGELADALDQIGRSVFDAILLDLSTPGNFGLQSLKALLANTPDTPILVLADEENDALGQEAVTLGAQDYLLPRHLDAYSLPRALHSIIELKTTQEKLFLEHELAIVTLNSIGDAVLSINVGGDVTYLNAVAEAMTGWTRAEAMNRPLEEVFHIVDGRTRKAVRDPLQSAIDKDRTVGLSTDCILIRRDGVEFAIEDSSAPIHDRRGRSVGAVIVFRDVVVSRALSGQMTYDAQHDLLTRLPNRILLQDRINQALAMARRKNKKMAVIFLDLDNFKAVNDFLGHSTGDKLLQSVANRLIASVRSSDTVSRHGGDEFVIALSDIAHARDAARSAKKLLLAISAPHSVADKYLQIYCSLGIAIYPEDGENADTLIHNADTAMYHAKQSGRNKSQFFRAEMNLRAAERLVLENTMRTGLENGEFLLHYQPKVNLETGLIVGIEALIRWQRPGQQLLAASHFIAAAEESGLIIQIGRWVLHEACRQASAWQQAGYPPIPISVNISALEFREKDFTRVLRTTLAATGLPARFLELELTEDVLMENTGSTAPLLKELKEIGVQLAVDDFGSGYSSLNYLRQIPIDSLKIGSTWVHQINADTNGSSMISSMINMGKSLNHRVVAEGIETVIQRNYLRASRCDLGQGYLFSRPVPSEDFTVLLSSGIAPQQAAARG